MSSLGSSIFKGMYSGCDIPCNLFDLEDELGDIDNPTATATIKKIRDVARSVGGLIQSKNFELRKEGESWVVNQKFFQSEFGTLEKKAKKEQVFMNQVIKECNINFEDEPSLANGTAFLIAKDLVLTVGHCLFDKNSVSESKNDGFPEFESGVPDLLIFDYDQNPTIENGKKKLEFPAKNVYKIVSIVAYELFEDEDKQKRDWALVKLDRHVIDRDPLEIDFESELVEGMDVWMVGHMQGLPKKWRGNAKIMQTSSLVTDKSGNKLECPFYFGANLPAFSGDSGAPIINKSSNKVIGKLNSGHRDYCIEDGIIKESEITNEQIKKNGYEHCLKMSSLAFLKPFFSPKNSLFLQNPSNHKQMEGISLEGECKNTECKPTSPFFIETANKIDVLKHKIKCQFCKHDMKNKVMVLFNCRYEIKAISKENKKFEGEFLFQRFNQEFGGELRFNLEKWKVLEIRRTDIKLSLYEQIGNYLPSKKTVVYTVIAVGCAAAAPSVAVAALPVLKSAGAATKAVVVASKVKAVCITAFALVISFSVWYSAPKKVTLNKLK